MQLVVLASIIASTIVGTWVGLRLIGVSRRTGQLPELYVGVALFVYAAISQPIALVYELLPEEAPSMLRMGLTTIRLAGFYVTLVALAGFVWRVFGTGSRVRAGVLAGSALMALLGYGISMAATWSQLNQGPSLGMPGRFGMTPSFIVVYAWSGLESLRYHRLMRRRLALGLADPVVTNRFLVWGLGSSAGGILLCGLLASSVRPGQDTVGSVLISASGLVSTLTWWLSFAPPSGYVSWLRRASAEAGQNA